MTGSYWIIVVESNNQGFGEHKFHRASASQPSCDNLATWKILERFGRHRLENLHAGMGESLACACS